MIKHHVDIEHEWTLILYLDVVKSDIDEVMETLSRLDCSKYDKETVNKLFSTKCNAGITYTNDYYKTTFVCVSCSTSGAQFFNSIVHEIKHIQSHICAYFNVGESGEEAAYLCGYIAEKIYKPFIKILKNYL